MIDAHCRATAIPLWQMWGGADVRPRVTDITIPITTQEKTLSLASGWYERGFRLFNQFHAPWERQKTAGFSQRREQLM